MSLLCCTDLAQKCKLYSLILTNRCNAHKTYTEDEAKAWLGSCTVSNPTDIALNKVSKFLKQPNKIDLVNEGNLDLLGISSEQIYNALITPHNMKQTKELVCISSYINSQGLIQVDDLAVLMLGTKDEEKQTKNPSVLDDLAGIDTSELLQNYVEGKTSEELYELCKNASKLLEGKDQTIEHLQKVTNEEKFDIARSLVCQPRLNVNSLITEIAVQDIERRFFINQFLNSTKDFITLDEDYSDLLLQQLSHKHVNITGNRMGSVLEEFFFLSLPYRFRLKDRDSTPSVDVLHQTLLGANAGEIKALYEIATFDDFKEVHQSDLILKQIQTMETTARTMQNLVSEIIYIWVKLECFLAFLEMCRILIPQLADFSVAAVDEPQSKVIPCNVIYRFKGWYYVKLEGDGQGVVSEDYKKILGYAFKRLSK